MVGIFSMVVADRLLMELKHIGGFELICELRLAGYIARSDNTKVSA